MKTIGYIACFFTLLFFVGSVGSCRKVSDPYNAIPPYLDGKYTGTFYFTSSLGIVYTHEEKPAEITFADGTYATASNMPPGYSGKYKLLSDTAVTFLVNGTPPPVSVYSTFLFDGQYSVRHIGDSVILTRNYPAILATYQYRLKRN